MMGLHFMDILGLVKYRGFALCGLPKRVMDSKLLPIVSCKMEDMLKTGEWHNNLLTE